MLIIEGAELVDASVEPLPQQHILFTLDVDDQVTAGPATFGSFVGETTDHSPVQVEMGVDAAVTVFGEEILDGHGSNPPPPW